VSARAGRLRARASEREHAGIMRLVIPAQPRHDPGTGRAGAIFCLKLSVVL